MQNTEKSLPVQAPTTPAGPQLNRRVDVFIEAILLAILVISPLMFGSVGILPVLIIETGVLLILFLWLLKCINQGLFEFAALPVNIPILLFLIFIFIQCHFISQIVPDFILGAVYKYKMRKESLKLISYAALFFIVVNNFQQRRRISRLIYVLICLGFCLSVFGMIQKLSGAQRILWAGDERLGEAFFSFFPNRNHFASYMNMIIFLALGGIFSQFPLLRDYLEGLNKRAIVKGLLASFQKGIWLYLFGLIIMSSGLFFSLSRAGMISFLCGLAFFSYLIARKGLTRRGYIFLLAVLLFTLGVLVWVNAPEQIAHRFSNLIGGKDAQSTSRMFEMRPLYVDKAVDMIGRYKIFGAGFGAFEFIYNYRYSPTLVTAGGKPLFYIDHLHNDFVELFCEVGVVGFAIFVIAAILYVFFVMRTLRKRHDPYVVGITAGAMASLLSMCVHSLFDFNFHITSNALLFFVVAGLGVTAVGSQARDGRETTLLRIIRLPTAKNIYLKIVLTAALLTGLFYAFGIISRPYITYAIASGEKAGITRLKKAIALDPLNDRYHFLLAQFYIRKARQDVDRSRFYIALASTEIREAIRLNPWDKYYPEYSEWIIKVFDPSVKEFISP